MRHSSRQDARLARARAGHDPNRFFISFDGGPLLCLLVALVTVGTAPLMWTRTTFMLGELRRGAASGVFVEEPSEAKKIR